MSTLQEREDVSDKCIRNETTKLGKVHTQHSRYTLCEYLHKMCGRNQRKVQAGAISKDIAVWGRIINLAEAIIKQSKEEGSVSMCKAWAQEIIMQCDILKENEHKLTEQTRAADDHITSGRCALCGKEKLGHKKHAAIGHENVEWFTCLDCEKVYYNEELK